MAPVTARAVAGGDSAAISPAAGLQEATKISRDIPGIVFDGNKRRSGTLLNDPHNKEVSAKGRLAAWSAKNALHAPLQRQRLQDLRHLLGDGTETASGVIGHFNFRSPDGTTWTPALSAGLEGFYYSKRSHETTHGASHTLGQLDDYFKYINELLSPVAWTSDLRRELQDIQISPAQPEDKNRLLNDFVLKTVVKLRSELMPLDKARWGRSSGIYMILSRAYNRTKIDPDGKPRNFFDSIDAEEFTRIRRETNSNTVWVLDMFEIGEINRWGDAGGSPYAIKGYTVKEELGGAEAFKRFVRRAHEQGMKVMVDYIPNHTSLDSTMMVENPEAFLHIVPPQPGPAEPIETYKKRIQDAAPRFHLRQVANYPEGNKRVPKWILVQHPYQGGGFSFTWLDMAQIDYTHPAARAYRLREARRIFEDYGIDGIRRDMSYFVLNKRFFTHWLGVLEWERDQAQGWAREELGRLVAEFKDRQKALGGREYLEEMMATIRTVNPEAFHIDEAYEDFEALSRSGSHARYNKIGLYDAIVSRNADWIRGALGELTFRSWQSGGAGLVNFVGTHDAGEGNPVDKLGAQFQPALAVAMSVAPTLTYNGLELGIGQSRMLLGDLSRSSDLEKSIPFDVKVKINWEDPDVANKEFFRRVTDFARRNQPIIQEGAMDVLAPREATPIVAYSAGRRDAAGRQSAIIVAANFGQNSASGIFRFAPPLLKDFGAFEPRADKKYILRDHANLDQNGSPTAYTRTGRQLLDEGLVILLPVGGSHLFEVEELDLSAATRAPPLAFDTAAPQSPAPSWISRAKTFLKADWDTWTSRLTKYSLAPYFFLQIPQVITNFTNISAGDFAKLAGLPWIGYSTGLLASFMLLSYFNAMKEKPSALVQVVGIAMNLIVLGQLAYVGFMPLAAYAIIAPLAIGGLILNYLNIRGKANPTLWKLWERGTALMALAAIPPSIFLSFGAVLAWSPAVTAAVSWATGATAFAAGVALVILDKKGKLPGRLKDVWTSLNAGSATALYTLNPLIGLTWIGLHPASIQGISATTNVLNMLGSMFQFPRGLHLRKGLWIFGNIWAITVGSWVALLAMTLYGALSAVVFWPLTAAVAGYLSFVLWQNAKNPAPTKP